MAVSYTHLDVYKRQSVYWRRFFTFSSFRSTTITSFPASDRLMARAAVSYTHLVSVQDFNIRRKYNLNILAIEHDRSTDIEVSPDYRFVKDDIVVVIGKVENVKRFERDMAE